MEINIESAVRILPTMYSNGEMLCAQPNTYNNTIQLGNQQTFPVTYALPADCTQNYLFATAINPLINLLVQGCDVSVVAIGQSGTGKTYTLLGPGLHCAYSESEHGIIPRCIREIFTRITQYPDRTTSVHITWTQICGENIQDLLNAGSVQCCTVSETFQWIQLGMTNMAPRHAHTLFTVTLEQQWVADMTVQHRISTASFADLASAEMCIIDVYGETKLVPADTGMATLWNIVGVLSQQERCLNYGNSFTTAAANNNNNNNNNVPYSQSTLTTLLRDSFGGRAKTLVVCCASPLLRDYPETLYTLQFALRVQNVKNVVTVNSFTSVDAPNYAADNSSSECVVNGNNGGADLFGVQFAAQQWLKLVSNAEELFQGLLTNKVLTSQELERISEWLMLKQECEECLSESGASLEPRRSLGRIDEEEEATSALQSSSSDSEENDDSDVDAQAAVMERLNYYMEQFHLKTDALISEQESDYQHRVTPSPKSATQQSKSQDVNSSTNSEYHMKGARGRRGSIQPSEDNILMKATPMLSSLDTPPPPPALALMSGAGGGGGASSVTDVVAVTESADPLEQLSALIASSEAKQKRIKHLTAKLDGIQRQADELQNTVEIKKQLIDQMVRNGDTRANARAKIQQKRGKVEDELCKAKAVVVQHETFRSGYPREAGELERCRDVVTQYEKRLKDIDYIKHIAEESSRRMLELENSLHTSRRQLEKLRKVQRNDDKQKVALEKELSKDRSKIAKLEKVTQKFKVEEEDKHLKEVNARISHLDHVLKEKNMNLERIEDNEEKESLRHEIRNLRRTRDCLVEQRCHLDKKLQKEKMLSEGEERKLLECEEAIEAIDAAIEYKNELICGRKQLDQTCTERENGESMLMARLMKLNENEMRTLLYKYFEKVIDLRCNSKRLESQLNDIERENEHNTWRVQTLSHTLQQSRLESERRIVVLQQQHENKLSLVMRHFADETCSASSDSASGVDLITTKHAAVQVRSRQVAAASTKATTAGAATAADHRDKTSSSVFAKFQDLTRYARHETVVPRQLHAVGADAPQAKVTRQKNKLIIQQSKRK